MPKTPSISDLVTESHPLLLEAMAAGLYCADAADHARKDEQPWPGYEAVAEQSKVPYRKHAERLLEVGLVLLPVARIQVLEDDLAEATQKPVRPPKSKRLSVRVPVDAVLERP